MNSHSFPPEKAVPFPGTPEFYFLGRSESALRQGFGLWPKCLDAAQPRPAFRGPVEKLCARVQLFLSKALMNSHSFSTPSTGMAL